MNGRVGNSIPGHEIQSHRRGSHCSDRCTGGAPDDSDRSGRRLRDDDDDTADHHADHTTADERHDDARSVHDCDDIAAYDARLHDDNAAWYYSTVSIGDPIIVQA